MMPPEAEDTRPETRDLRTEKWSSERRRRVPEALQTVTWPSEGLSHSGRGHGHSLMGLVFHICA